MATLPAHDSLVQSLVDALSPVLTPLLRSMSLLDLLRGSDRTVRDALLEATCRVAEQAFSQPRRPPRAAYRKACTLHSAFGPLALVLWGLWGDADQVLDPIPASLWAHGCTATVREQITVLHALGTTQETALAMGLFLPSPPSLSTIHRVALEEGNALAAQCSPEQLGGWISSRVEAIADQVHLIVVGADGGHVPMRAEGSSATREWHEGRVVTVTLLGAADPQKPRTVTCFEGGKHEQQVGSQRPVLATIVMGQMPSLQGPRSDRVEQALQTAFRELGQRCAQARWQGVCDGGDWPEQILDATVGAARRTTDICHASAHRLDAAQARFADEDKAHAWWAHQRTRLLTEHGHAHEVAEALARRATAPAPCPDRPTVRREAGYFGARKGQMAYAERLAADEMIGSGPTEAAVKQLITVRMKRVGATWGAEGGDAVLHTRSLVMSGLWTEAWRERLHHQFAPYDVAA